MAENGAVYMGADPWTHLSVEHGQLAQGQVKLAAGQGEIRQDVWSSTGNVRHDVANGFADTRHDICSATGDIRRDVGSNAADIRREGAVERGEIRYDVATRAGDIRRETAEGISDVRREQALGFGDTKYSIAEHSEDTNRDVLTSGYQTREKVSEVGANILQRSTDYFIAEQARDFDMGRDLADLKVQVAMGTQKTQADIALAQAQTGKEILESKYDLARQIGIENEKTRDLINALKNDELNRLLIERNTDLQHCRHDYWGARDGLINSQFAALSSQVNSQVNALNSQLAETRQGLVNFGTMAGNAGQQSSTSNQVR